LSFLEREGEKKETRGINPYKNPHFALRVALLVLAPFLKQSKKLARLAPTYVLTLLRFASLSVLSPHPNTTHGQGDECLSFLLFGVAIKKPHTTNLK
jgi:hypothetical protein